MHPSNVTPIHSSYFQQLKDLFESLDKPYGPSEIVRFNLAYSCIYPLLSPPEKSRTEAFVDELIANLEDSELAPTIYGVV